METCHYKKIEIKSCPVCTSTDLVDVFDHPKKYILNDFTCEFENSYCICKDCCFVFTRDPLDEESLKNYYESDSQERSYDATCDEKVHMQDQFNFLSWNGVDVRAKNILEVGAGNGTFLDLLKTKGANSEGLYYDELSADSKEILDKKQCKCILVDKVGLSDSSNLDIGLIVMNHTLEHLVNPANKLKKLFNIISNRGYLYIEVPGFTYDNQNTDNVIFQHVNFFSEGNLKLLLEKVGFNVVAIQNDYDADYTACSKNILRILATKNIKTELVVNDNGILAESKKPKTWSEYRDSFCEREANRKRIYGLIDSYLSNEMKKEESQGKMRVAFWTARSETGECLSSIMLDRYNIVAIFDRNKKHWGKEIFGVQVFDPEKLSQLGVTHIIIPNQGYESDIKNGLEKYAFHGIVMGWSDFVKSK